MTKSSLGPTASRIIGLYALIAVHGWFVLEYTYPSAGQQVALALSILKISGLLAAAIFVMGTFGAMAFAADRELDERELSERNSAFVRAYEYLFVMLLLSSVIPEGVAKLLNTELTVAFMKDFILLLFATGFVLPGFLLAWRARAEYACGTPALLRPPLVEFERLPRSFLHVAVHGGGASTRSTHPLRPLIEAGRVAIGDPGFLHLAQAGLDLGAGKAHASEFRVARLRIREPIGESLVQLAVPIGQFTLEALHHSQSGLAARLSHAGLRGQTHAVQHGMAVLRGPGDRLLGKAGLSRLRIDDRPRRRRCAGCRREGKAEGESGTKAADAQVTMNAHDRGFLLLFR